MEDLIEIYTFYNDFLQTSEQKKKYLNTHIKQYKKYPNLFKFFESSKSASIPKTRFRFSGD